MFIPEIYNFFVWSRSIFWQNIGVLLFTFLSKTAPGPNFFAIIDPLPTAYFRRMSPPSNKEISMCTHACAHACFCILTPLDIYLKNSEKYFQNKKNIFRILYPLLKKTFFNLRGDLSRTFSQGGRGKFQNWAKRFF